MPTPLPICYLNGQFLPLATATVSPLDRAFLFGDAVYEVIPVYGGRPFRFREHFDRLARSLAAIRMPAPLAHEAWAAICTELMTRNEATGRDLYVYVQVSRGAEFGRNHAWPEGLSPTLFAYVSPLDPVPAELFDLGVKAVTAEDIRWARCDIKSTSLLANVLLKKLSQDAGAFETILLGDGLLREGSSTTVHVVRDGVLETPPNTRRILPGTTRDVVTELAERIGLPSVVREIPEAALRAAAEIWLSFSTRGVLPVASLDGRPVGDGRAGPAFRRLNHEFLAYRSELAGEPVL
jgi:D-alanine transaminase